MDAGRALTPAASRTRHTGGMAVPEELRIRRPPPPFRVAEVVEVADRSPHLRRLVLAGPELVGFAEPEPAASIRWLPARGDALEIPEWNGNEFLYADGSRPPIRTLTPLEVDGTAGRLAVEVVLHGAGPLSDWARRAAPGMPVAVSGPGRGYVPDPEAPHLLLAGDETAIPAIGQVLAAAAPTTRVDVAIEARPDAVVTLPDHPQASVRWHEPVPGEREGEALVRAVAAVPLEPGSRAWVAGEAAAVQRVRRLLFEERGLPRSVATVRGYWKHGRRGT